MTKPFAYQLEDAETIKQMGYRCLVANPMGSGKSLEALLAAQGNPAIKRILVICPASVKWGWQHEASLHFNMRSTVLQGARPYYDSAFNTPLVIINYDILEGWLPSLLEYDPDLVIIDECHYCMSPRTKRTKCVYKVCFNAPYVMALSGTPFVNRPIEMWPVLNILRSTWFPSYYSYAHRYCGPKKTVYGWEFKGMSNTEELNNILKDVVIRRRKEDILKDLPPKRRIVIPLPLKDYKEYNQCVKDFVGWLSSNAPERLTAAMRAEAVVKMGYLKRLTGTLKLDAVIDWLDDWLLNSDGKIIVFAVHKAVIARLRDTYKKMCVVVDGSVSGRARQDCIDKFRINPNCRMFIGNIKAAGVGWNGQVAEAVAFVEVGWHPGGQVQAEDRAHRIGTKKSVSCYYLTAHDTIEERIVKLLQTKAEMLDKVLDGGEAFDKFAVFDELCLELAKEKQNECS